MVLKMASGTVCKKAIERLSECPVCTDFDSIPKQLPCHHTICLQCIENILSSTRDKEDDPHLKVIFCPLCRSEVELPNGNAKNLPTNLLMAQLQETVAATDVKGVDEQKMCERCLHCQESDPKVSELYCKDCSKYLCKQCAMRHKERPLFFGHNIVPKQYVLCREHKTNFQYLCLNCEKFLCEACVDTGACDKHDIQAVKEIEPSKLRDIDALIEDIENNMLKEKANVSPMIEKIKSKIKATEDTKLTIRVQCSTTIERLKREEQRLVQEVQNRQDTLVSVLRMLETGYDPKLLSDLRDAAKEAKEMGVEQIIMSLPAIRARLPQPAVLPPSEAINMDIRYVPADHLPRLGEVITNHPTRLLWKKPGLLEGTDVTFLPSGSFAVSDRSNGNVMLYDTFGNPIANSAGKGVNLKGPYGISHYPKESAIAVADHDAGGVTLLDNRCLRHIRHIKLTGVNHPEGLAVLQCGKLVVTHSGKVSIHDSNGKKLKEWKTYGQKNKEKKQFKSPHFVTVDSLDHIWVSDCYANKIILFTSTGEFLQEVTSPEGSNLGLSVDKDFKIHVAIQEDGVHKGSAPDEDFKQLIKWDTKLKEFFGEVSSVDVQGSYMVIVARTGVAFFTTDQEII